MPSYKLFKNKSPWIMKGLIDEFALSEIQSASILGNIGHECAGFTQMQEGSPIGGGRGGYGWCQWTGSRRVSFEDYAKKHKLGIDSDKANYGYLLWELHNTHKKAIGEIRKYDSIGDCVRAFEEIFEKANKNYKHYDRREEYARIALEEFADHAFDLAEAVFASGGGGVIELRETEVTEGAANAPIKHDDTVSGIRAAISPPVVGVSSIFAKKLAQMAQNDFDTYNGLLEQQSPLKERIGKYWAFVGRPDLDGSDHDVPWSAAFISYMVHLAGAGSSFPYSAQHSTYVYRTINDKLTKKKKSFWGYEVSDINILPGDILGMNRNGADEIFYDWAAHHADYKSHSDIVVAVEGDVIHTIGGNVGKAPGQINKKKFGIKEGKLVNLAANADQIVFVVIRSFLP